ncbi:methyltransferase domain-containing protein [Caballeronia sp. GAWG1-1]|uniref:methyltransferase domain-containing protein n=1 Tax=Caballeronia sp. GAWG1-1 TaxID=2921742 RepID=UPI0020288FE8|nr:methyltransferase domain-containing protein [Caballeronia sp. GAWG1-1]
MDRSIILAGLNPSQLTGVEIGPLHRPFVRRVDGEIIYVDYTDRPTLVEKYRNDPNVNVAEIVDVDAIWGRNTLADAVKHRKVDYIVASHVIEHVPDLVTWLGELRSILKDSGTVRLAVPDRRFTFDFLRQETRLSDVLTAFLCRARLPQTHEILDHHLNVASVDCGRAWDGALDLANLKPHRSVSEALRVARDALEQGTYYDSHCWVFTPRSFATLFLALAESGLIDFACERFEDTQKYTLEFFVGLRPSKDKVEIIESWKRVQSMARELPVDAFEVTERERREREDIISAQEKSLNQQAQALREVSEELRVTRHQLAEARVAITHGESAQIRVAEMEHSNSWRVTAPLRSVVTMARRWSR